MDGEANHSYPSTAKVKNAWNYTCTPPYVCMARYLVKHILNCILCVIYGFLSG
jgi:hypothetical protein